MKTTSFVASERTGLRRLPDVPAFVAEALFALIDAVGFRDIPSGEPSNYAVFVHVATPTWQHTVYLRHGAARADRLGELVAALQRAVAGIEGGDAPAVKPPKPGRFIVTELIDGGACHILPEGSYYPMNRRQSFGPDSREACERWVAEHCR